MNSKKKHNISYIKPNEPPFLKRLKLQAGYVEGPSVETKKEILPRIEDGDDFDKDDEKPTVVVLQDDDLTAEEAEAIEKAKKIEEAVKAQQQEKADLSQKVIFKRKKDSELVQDSDDKSIAKPKKKKKEKKVPRPTLSFNDEDE